VDVGPRIGKNANEGGAIVLQHDGAVFARAENRLGDAGIGKQDQAIENSNQPNWTKVRSDRNDAHTAADLASGGKALGESSIYTVVPVPLKKPLKK